MVTSQEIIERTFYIALLDETIKRGLTINPDDYLDPETHLPTASGQQRFAKDMEAIGTGKFIFIYGVGNNQVRGAKTCPRITIELKAYYPGEIGIEKYDYERDENKNTFHQLDYDFNTRDILIDVHLVSNTQAQMRTLHDIMFRALPSKGYVKPYLNDYKEWKESCIWPTGNFFIEVSNYYDHPDFTNGLLEKVYTFTVRDGLLPEKVSDVEIVPIRDITCIIAPEDASDVSFTVSDT